MLKAEYFICPDCGAEVRVGSRGCARCASDRATKAWDKSSSNLKSKSESKSKPAPKPTSWSQDEVYDGLDLPEEDFDYEAFLEEEFGSGKRKSRLHRVWWLTAVVLLVAMAAGWAFLVF